MKFKAEMLLGMFTVVYFFIGFLAGIFSVHGSDDIVMVGFALAAVASILLWGTYRFSKHQQIPNPSGPILLWGGALFFLLPVAIIFSLVLLDARDVARNQKIAAETKVTYLGDELLLSPQGNPIGVHVKYSIVFPQSGPSYYDPGMTPITHHLNNLDVSSYLSGFSSIKIDPPVDPRYFEAGKIYVFTAGLRPSFFFEGMAGGAVCLRKELQEGFRRVNGEQFKTHFSVTVSGTTFRGQTDNEYSLESFYDSFVREGMVGCR